MFAPRVARIPLPAVVKISHQTDEISLVATKTIDDADDDKNVRCRQRYGATNAGGRVRSGRGVRPGVATAAAKQGFQGVSTELRPGETAQSCDDAREKVDGRAKGTNSAERPPVQRTRSRRAAVDVAFGQGQQRGATVGQRQQREQKGALLRRA